MIAGKLSRSASICHPPFCLRRLPNLQTTIAFHNYHLAITLDIWNTIPSDPFCLRGRPLNGADICSLFSELTCKSSLHNHLLSVHLLPSKAFLQLYLFFWQLLPFWILIPVLQIVFPRCVVPVAVLFNSIFVRSNSFLSNPKLLFQMPMSVCVPLDATHPWLILSPCCRAFFLIRAREFTWKGRLSIQWLSTQRLSAMHFHDYGLPRENQKILLLSSLWTTILADGETFAYPSRQSSFQSACAHIRMHHVWRVNFPQVQPESFRSSTRGGGGMPIEVPVCFQATRSVSVHVFPVKSLHPFNCLIWILSREASSDSAYTGS